MRLPVTVEAQTMKSAVEMAKAKGLAWFDLDDSRCIATALRTISELADAMYLITFDVQEAHRFEQPAYGFARCVYCKRTEDETK